MITCKKSSENGDYAGQGTLDYCVNKAASVRRENAAKHKSQALQTVLDPTKKRKPGTLQTRLHDTAHTH